MALAILAAKQQYGLRLLLSVGGDEDMKIAGDSFSPLPAEDPAETEARRFLRQKSVGNIEKARELGKLYAREIVNVPQSSPLGTAADCGQMEFHHQLVLCSYVVNRVIAEHSPDSILAQTSLRVFYDEVERASAVMYTHISDPAAFSLYTLWERSRGHDEDEIGRIYAKLCGLEGDAKAISNGNALYGWFTAVCAQFMENTAYTEVDPA
jgi:hypothetical protein